MYTVLAAAEKMMKVSRESLSTSATKKLPAKKAGASTNRFFNHC
jgi:hypothetical protein